MSLWPTRAVLSLLPGIPHRSRQNSKKRLTSFGMWWIILIRGKNWRNESIRLKKDRNMRNFEDLQIAVAGTGYVGLSIATLLSQHHKVTAVDVIPEKVEKINNRISPIQDEYIEKYFAEKELNLTATLDGASAYKDADFVVNLQPPNKLRSG